MKHCRVCEHEIEPIISFGKQPLANGFISQENFNKEYFYELQVGVCNNCKMFQLLDAPSKEQMFHNEYPFFTESSQHMSAHFRNFAQEVLEQYIENRMEPFVLEIGANDGVFLETFAQKNIRHLGVDPSTGPLDRALEKGINTLPAFFNSSTAKDIFNNQGNADIIYAANCICHIEDIVDVFRGVELLLKTDGLFIFEEPYLGDVIRLGSFDQIYDEHVYLFSLESISYLANTFNMHVVDAKPLEVHGGSMRYTLSKKNTKFKGMNLVNQLENFIGIQQISTYTNFAKQCEIIKEKIIELAMQIKTEGKTLAGYAATSKSTTILNYCQLGPDVINFICDTTPEKIGKYSPGMHVPVASRESIGSHFPDYFFLFAWNHAEEIFAKETQFDGGWLTHISEPHIYKTQPKKLYEQSSYI